MTFHFDPIAIILLTPICLFLWKILTTLNKLLEATLKPKKQTVAKLKQQINPGFTWTPPEIPTYKEVKCPRCHKLLKIQKDFFGQTTCNKCQHTVKVNKPVTLKLKNSSESNHDTN